MTAAPEGRRLLRLEVRNPDRIQPTWLKTLMKMGVSDPAQRDLVAETPPPFVAELLGYSYQVAQRHAEIAAQPRSQYVK